MWLNFNGGEWRPTKHHLFPKEFTEVLLQIMCKAQNTVSKSKVIKGVKDGKRLARHICIIAERARHVKGGCRGSRSFYPLHDCEFLLLRQSVGKEYFKLRMNLTPIPASAGPFSCNVYLSQVEHFKQAVIVREYRPVF